MKTWENWSIDCGDKDESKVVISGSATSLDRVYIDFASGAEAGDYIITYNDGIRCITKTYTVAGAPCSCTVTSTYTSSNSHSASAENEKFSVGSISESNCDCPSFNISLIEGDDLLHLNDAEPGLGIDIETGTIWALSGVSENTSSETRHVKYSISCDTCNGELVFYQKGTVVTCDCDSFAFEGVEETSPTASITLSLHNGGSTSLNLGVFEIFTTESSVQVPVNYQIAAGETKDVLVANYDSNEGNTVVRVEGTISDTSYCFTFICPGQYCDLIDGDTLTVEVASTISCS